MELTGNTADRWEQISKHISELSSEIEKNQAIAKDAISTMKQIGKNLTNLQSKVDELSTLAYKEVLREESGTINDEAPVFDDAVKDSIKPKSDNKKPLINTEPDVEEQIIDATRQTKLLLDDEG